jgi:subtilisin family serine protease
MHRLFSPALLSEYHPGMLIVRMRSAVETPVRASAVGRTAKKAARRGTRTAAAAASSGINLPMAMYSMPPEVTFPTDVSPGMSVLALLERSGKIRRSVLMSAREAPASSAPAGAMRAMSMMMAATAAPPASRRNLREKKTTAQNGVALLEIEPGADLAELRSALAADAGVESVSLVPTRYLLARKKPARHVAAPQPLVAAAVPPPASTMWNLMRIDWQRACNLPGFKDGAGVKVAVLDTGIDRDHPDLNARVAGYTYSYPAATSPVGAKDYVGHGTHVAGTISAVGNNGFGINGICRAEIHAWKIFNDETYFFPELGYFSYVVDPVMYQSALADCLEQDMNVMNLSIGGPGEPDHQEARLFELLLENNTTIVAAMGNEREQGSPTSYPAAIPGVIAVGATTINDTLAGFSNRGPHISLSAPGSVIWSTMPTYAGRAGYRAVFGPDNRPQRGIEIKRETNYDISDGTSMASPHVAAAAALAMAKHGPLTPGNVASMLASSADKVLAMNGALVDQDFGAGRLNLLKLLK